MRQDVLFYVLTVVSLCFCASMSVQENLIVPAAVTRVHAWYLHEIIYKEHTV